MSNYFVDNDRRVTINEDSAKNYDSDTFNNNAVANDVVATWEQRAASS